jgi:hypothetical protein
MCFSDYPLNCQPNSKPRPPAPLAREGKHPVRSPSPPHTCGGEGRGEEVSLFHLRPFISQPYRLRRPNREPLARRPMGAARPVRGRGWTLAQHGAAFRRNCHGIVKCSGTTALTPATPKKLRGLSGLVRAHTLTYVRPFQILQKNELGSENFVGNRWRRRRSGLGPVMTAPTPGKARTQKRGASCGKNHGGARIISPHISNSDGSAKAVRRVGARGLQTRPAAPVGRVPPRGVWTCETCGLGLFRGARSSRPHLSESRRRNLCSERG